MTNDTSDALVRHWPFAGGEAPEEAPPATELTESWGDPVSVSSYLDRCQVDALTTNVGGMDLRDHMVASSVGFYKVEINQINALLAKLKAEGDS